VRFHRSEYVKVIVCCDVMPYAQNMKAACSFETSINYYQTAWRHIPEKSSIQVDVTSSVIRNVQNTALRCYGCVEPIKESRLPKQLVALVITSEGKQLEVQRFIRSPLRKMASQNSALGIPTAYGLDDRGFRVRVPVRSEFSLPRIVQSSSGAHSASYPMGTEGSFPGGKATGA
jgi:hypothetical protein